MRRIRAALLVILACVLTTPLVADERADIAAARAVFEKNIDAIRHHDRATYLSLYLHSDKLIRGGPTGFVTGWSEFEKARGPYPETIDASDLHLVSVQPGVVYGTYRYRVRYSGLDEHTGISERLFVRTKNGWKIAMTGAIDAPPGTPPSPRAIIGATLIDGRGGASRARRERHRPRAGRSIAPAPRRSARFLEGVEVIDAKGMWLTPGLIDAHVHFSQTGWADGRPDSLDLRAQYPYEKVEADLKANSSDSRALHLLRRDFGLRRRRLSVDAAAGETLRQRQRRSTHRRSRAAALDTRPLAQPSGGAAVHPSSRRSLGARRASLPRLSAGLEGDQGLVHRPRSRSSGRSLGACRESGGRVRARARPAADRPRHRPGRSESGPARRSETARAQRLGSAHRRRVPRWRSGTADPDSDAHGAARLRTHVPVGPRPQAAGGRRSQPLRRPRHAGEDRIHRHSRSFAREGRTGGDAQQHTTETERIGAQNLM